MINNLSFQEKYSIIGTKDPTFEGSFITAVKTTGIFCRPSCRARKPKAENVIFYQTPKEAIQHGYRPCKVCKPMHKLDETPEYIQEIIKELHQNPYLRINAAFSRIEQGDRVTDTAMDSGYESLSGFNERYRSIFGEAPTGTNQKTVINLVRFTTPIGPMFAGATRHGLCLLEFTDRRMLETEFKDLRKRLNSVILPGETEILTQTQSELSQYFEGKRKDFSIPLDTPGTDFQQSVWQMLQKIPYGETRSYKEQAIAINNPRAVRAVASANGHNRVAIIIPCHRVIGSDGSLTGYGGGLHRKQWLLDLERENV